MQGFVFNATVLLSNCFSILSGQSSNQETIVPDLIKALNESNKVDDNKQEMLRLKQQEQENESRSVRGSSCAARDELSLKGLHLIGPKLTHAPA